MNRIIPIALTACLGLAGAVLSKPADAGVAVRVAPYPGVVVAAPALVAPWPAVVGAPGYYLPGYVRYGYGPYPYRYGYGPYGYRYALRPHGFWHQGWRHR